MDDIRALKREGQADSRPVEPQPELGNVSLTRFGPGEDGCDGFTGASAVGTTLLLSSHPGFLTLPRLSWSL